MGTRATVRVLGNRTVKCYRNPAQAEAEAAWYRRVPWAAPRLLDVDGSALILQTLPTAARDPSWRPAHELRAILQALHAEGIHHRDVHIRNIVRGPDGPLLIDWETAIHWPAALSYDLDGPEASGVPVPEIHKGLMPQWWGSTQPASIRMRWRPDGVPTSMGRRT